MKISQDELLNEIRKALERPAGGDGSTVQELTAAMGCHENKVRKALQAIQREGRLEVARVYRVSLDGTMRKSPAYRIKA